MPGVWRKQNGLDQFKRIFFFFFTQETLQMNCFIEKLNFKG